jgi:putative SOS response-associated peptidase YedK
MAETVDTKSAFRSAFERRRCLVPIDNFYEWQKDRAEGQASLRHRARRSRHRILRSKSTMIVCGGKRSEQG